MLDQLRQRLSYANVTATLALVVALGGTGAWAADKITSNEIAKNAVRSKHVKKNQINGKHLKDGAVDSPKLATGAAGGNLSIAVRKSSVPLPDNSITETVAACDPGERAVGGGARSGFVTSDIDFASSYPVTATGDAAEPGDTPSGWLGAYFNVAGGAADTTLEVYAICLR